jgi:hypothetical protein
VTAWLGSNVTGWGVASAVIIGFVTSLARGWIVLRPVHRALLAAEAKAVAAEQARTAAEVTKTEFYREAYALERERNNVLSGGLVAMVAEIRRAVGDPKREPSL